MIPCVVLGDSIAVGVGQNRPECHTTARVGITSAAYVQGMLPYAQVNADTAIISLGVNDDPSAATYDNLRYLRANLRVRQVYWIVPYSREYARAAVRQVAQLYNDRILDLRDYGGYMAGDRVHPTGYGYQTIAARLGQEGAPDYRMATTQYQYQYAYQTPAAQPPSAPAAIPFAQQPAQEPTWPRYETWQTAYARTHEYAWMREPWARRAIARQELAREAWGRTVSHRAWPQVQHPIQVAARAATGGHAVTAAHQALPTPPVPPVVGRIENGHLTVYRTLHDWKAASAHRG